jgi:hypothetical protein
MPPMFLEPCQEIKNIHRRSLGILNIRKIFSKYYIHAIIISYFPQILHTLSYVFIWVLYIPYNTPPPPHI